MMNLAHELFLSSLLANPRAVALKEGARELDYQSLFAEIGQAGALFLSLGLLRSERVAVYL